MTPEQVLYARYLCSRDALGLKAGQARRATIGYLVYKSKFSFVEISGTRNRVCSFSKFMDHNPQLVELDELN